MDAVKLTDVALQAKLSVMRKSRKTRLSAAIVLMIVIVIIGVAISFAGGAAAVGWIVVVLMIADGALIIVTVRKSGEIKKFISENVTKILLEEAFEVEKYAYDSHIIEDLIRGSGLMYIKWDRCSGSDYVEGKYKGHDIMFSDIKLERRQKGHNSEGDAETTYSSVFKGQWIFIKHDVKLDSPLRVIERPPLIGGSMKSNIETENVSFNKKFQILAKDRQTAFLILTPLFMEYIISADVSAQGLTSISFDEEWICAAVYNNTDSFEVSGKQMKDISAVRKAQRGDIAYVTRIIDEFMLNDFLFKKITKQED
jgi:hypothetical protein